MSRRTTELLLLLAASPVVILLFVLAILNDGKPLDVWTLAVPLGLFTAFIISHVAIRLLAPNADAALLPIAFVLSGIGIAFVMRLGADIDPNMASRQVLWLFVGIAAMVLTLVFVRSVRNLGNYKYTIIILGVVFLILPAVIGIEQNGSKIWLQIAGVSFQPGEIAKFLIVLFLAGYLADNREMLSVSGRRLGPATIPDFKTLVPLILMWVLSMGIVVFQRDLGSALLFFGIFLVMLYVATGRLSYIITAVGLGAVGAVAAFFVFGHVQDRVEIWLDPFAHERGYQLTQALYSLAEGDLIGTGIGRGMPTLIPIVASDFIFAAIAEEMGLIGASGLLLLFVLFAVRGLAIASRARSDMEAFTATGLTAAISLQAFVIVGGVTLLIPLTGVTLPFISQGGSSLLSSFIILGLLLRTSDAGTGHEMELQSTAALDGGVLGRFALGKRITVLITCFCLIFAVAIGNLTYEMIVRAPALRAMPSNNHQLIKEERAQRGTILTADGVILAESVPRSGDKEGYQRIYPEGSMAAHLIGYASAKYGLAGIEASQQEVLRGEVGFSNWRDVVDTMAGKPLPGNDVTLTIDSRIQRSAEGILEGRSGAVVALDARTGEVLAMASSPTYDINAVEDLLKNSGDDGAGIGGGTSQLYNRATTNLYAPGSTFKMVTLTAALERGGITLADTYKAPGKLEIGNAFVTNYKGESYGTISVKQAFELSSNTVFAQLSEKIGAKNLVSAASEFGFGRKLGQDFYVEPSLMPNPADMTTWETAWAAAGEPVGEHPSSPPGPQATVMQMALVCSAFANGGTIMNPYVVASTSSANGQKLTTTSPQTFGRAVSDYAVSKVNESMAGVVTQGTGMAAQIGGKTVRGKTGTAERTGDTIDSWFVGYVDVGKRSVVVAVVLEDAESGAATPNARQVLQKAVEIYG
ncbi:MAG: FtsW/RodA/SpoVE family cell cycle protein [Coriobacteriia bacterium]|nr:FtsW/RodA/SpoVE family cell cycle protein [Coriobacteriia bacterium]